MGLKAYLLVDMVDNLKQDEFMKELKALEELPGVEYVDPVIGSKDLIIMIDAPVTVEAVAGKIRSRASVKNVEILRIVSIFERHKTVKMPLLNKKDVKSVPELLNV
jgi:hypothetical protein